MMERTCFSCPEDFSQRDVFFLAVTDENSDSESEVEERVKGGHAFSHILSLSLPLTLYLTHTDMKTNKLNFFQSIFD